MRFVDYFYYLYQHEYTPSDLLISVEIETEKLVHQTVPYQPGALFWGGQLSGSVSSPF